MATFTTRDDVTIYYKDWGPRDGEVVILSHGWPLNADSWESQAFHLASNGYRVITHDREPRLPVTDEGFMYGKAILVVATHAVAAVLGFLARNLCAADLDRAACAVGYGGQRTCGSSDIQGSVPARSQGQRPVA